jgi:hypothetical protein
MELELCVNYTFWYYFRYYQGGKGHLKYHKYMLQHVRGPPGPYI